MPSINSFSNPYESFLPSQRVDESATAYYFRREGFKFSAQISTETLTRSDSITSLISVTNSCCGVTVQPDNQSTPVSTGPHPITMYPRVNKTTFATTGADLSPHSARRSIEAPEIKKHPPEYARHTKPKSSFRRFWQGLVQCFLPGIRFKK